MKRLRSFDDDLDVVGGEKGSCKDWERRDRDRDRDRERSRDRDRDRSLERSSSSHRSSRYYSSKAENGRNRTIDDDRESSRLSRKRLDHHEYDGYDRRRTSPRYRDSIDRGVSISSPRNVYGSSDRIHRSESFSGFRRDFPKGYISERERERSSREESVSSWRRLSGCKDIVEEDYKLGAELGRGSRLLLEDRGNVKSPQGSREVVRSPQGSREVLKSPQGSREVIKSPQSSREVIKSSQSPRDVVKSPPGSKDSWGEQSKSVDGKRSDEVHGVSSSSSSEMEEGELEPETEPELESIPEPLVQTNIEAEISLRGNSESKDFVPEEKLKMEKTLIDDSEPLSEKKLEHDIEGVCDENEEGRMLDTMTAVSKGSNGLQECGSASEEKEGNIREDNDFLHSSDHVTAEKDGNEEVNNANSDKSSCPYEEPKEKDGLYLELQVEEIDSKELSLEENRNTDKTLALMTDTLIGKDKGKRVAIYPSSEVNSRGNSQWFERDLLGCRDDALEGPSCRGFELFSSSVVPRPEKTNHSVVSNDGKLKDEPLELSLGLPNVLLPLPSHDSKAAPSSPSRARSVQSLPNTFRTSSEGFSGSMSFSGSQTFVHNPSCSLTQNSYENYEQSVGSHPIFQGIDQQASQVTWPGQFPNDPKHVESPIYQRLLYGNGSLGSHTPQGIMYSQAMQGQHKFQLTEGNTGIPVGLDRQSNLHRQLSGLQSKKNIEVRSPTNSVGSRGTRSEFSNDKKHIMKGRNGSLYRSSSQKTMDQIVVGGIGFVERIITMIISEPVQVMARRIQEMEEQSIIFLKESACEIMVNKDKHGQLVMFQEALKKRSDLTVEILLKCHRVQLEILVAFKTGLQDFFQRVGSIASSDLAEIYLNLRCKNLACLSLLPVDDCDCKVCVQKNGFCSACMCLICSKFDMALNTCSWVGCDVCLHWCHTDCGLQKSYVRNGRISGEAQDTTEMQFHCVACNHPSEMFGFVKEVFKTCAKEWSVETLTKELEYVKRIFSASNDRRGKQLYIIADKMIARLEIKSNLTEVYNQIMQFLAESDTDFGNTPSVSLKERPHKNSAEDSNRVAGPSQVAMMLASASNENIPQRESTNTAPSRLDWDQMGGRSGNLELQVSVGKMPVVDELESIIRIKLAEAKMFQSRADDARKEAEGLKCIAVAKNDKIDEEYSSRITKLRLAEAEERHKQKLEELNIMEKEHREYFNMKMRMESDIRVLLLKMEATKQNYST
ncbi:Oberon-like protein [Thalictrum thalictroides]|uniref:Oberon-like protein n=1 Tax=Thalictrum thalictroides TaxID=46969 RepID=A0A7J6W7D7_THATH|nr:Oberon-like protein [Thalictrum thalictroides]